MLNKKNIIITVASLLITSTLLVGCGGAKVDKPTTSTKTQTTTTQETKVEDKEEALKKELLPTIEGFVKANLEFDYTKYTLEDYKKYLDYCSEDIKKNSPEQKFVDQFNRIKKAEGIAKVTKVTIDKITPRDTDMYDIEYTATQETQSYKENGKDYANTKDDAKCTATVKKENNKFVIVAYKIP